MEKNKTIGAWTFEKRNRVKKRARVAAVVNLFDGWVAVMCDEEEWWGRAQ